MAAKNLERLDKCVAHLTGMSRKQAAKAIKEGDVSVDGDVLTTADAKVSIDSAIVIAGFNDDDLWQDDADSEVLRASDAFKKRVFLLNKPYDFVCADRDKNHRIVLSLFAEELKSDTLHCAGRLDRDTTGLIIVTDDGDLIHDITSPKKSVAKLYHAVLDKPLPDNAVKLFKRGIRHPEEKERYRSALLIPLPDASGRHRACVSLTEGRFHEVKRLFECVGCTVTALSRLAVGALTLDDELSEAGSYRLLSDSELELLNAQKEFTPEEMLALADAHEAGLRRSLRHMTHPAYVTNASPETEDPAQEKTDF